MKNSTTKQGLAIIIYFLFVGSAAVPQLQAMNAEEIYKFVLPSVVTLIATDQNGVQSIGTAFLINENGVAVTAYHLVSDAMSAIVKFSTGEEFNVSGLIDSDEKRDVALIRIKVFGRTSLLLKHTFPDVGVRAYVIGAPRAYEFSISDGLVSQVQVIEGVKYIQFSCPASPGNSGGPLLDSDGLVLGVVSSQRTDAQNLSFAVPSEYILGLDSSLPTRPWANNNNSDIVKAKSVTVEDCDQLLLDHYLWMSDTQATLGIVEHFNILKDNGFRGGVPADLFVAQRTGQQLKDRFAKSSATDPNRRTMLDYTTRRFQYEMECVDLLIQSIRTAQTANGWTPEASDLLARSQAAWRTPVDSVIPDSTTIAAQNAIWDSISRLPVCPTYIGRMMRNENQSQFSLGVYSYTRDSLLIGMVFPQSIALELGIKPGDKIIKLNDFTPIDIDEFKMHLKHYEGKRVQIIVQREGSNKILRATVPSPLVQ